MSTPVVSVPDVSTPVNAMSRMVGVFFSPKPTFADIARRPTWLPPVIVLTLISVVACVVINQRINWREFIGHQIDQSSRASQLSPEQRSQQIEQGAKIAPIFTYVFGVPGTIVAILLVALVMWGAYNLLGNANATFSQSLGIVSHSFMPSLLSALIFILVLFLRPKGDVNLENPIAANLAAFLQDTAPKWLVALGKSVDLFTIWIIVLIALGFAAVNPKKLKGATPYAIAFGVWAVFILVRVGWAFIFS